MQTSPTASLLLSPDRPGRVAILRAGRAQAAGDDAPVRPSLDPVRKARIRARILSGAYASLEVVDALARRLLVSGDL